MTVLCGPTWMVNQYQSECMLNQHIYFMAYPRKKDNVFKKYYYQQHINLLDTFKNSSRDLNSVSLRVVCLIHSGIGVDCLHSNLTRCQPL